MVSVTLNTIGRNLPWFIAEVLRNNLPDPNGRDGKDWILKSQTTDPITFDSLPRIVIDVTNLEILNPTVDTVSSNQLLHTNTITLEILVYAKSISQRDELSDDIKAILFNPQSKDSDGNTLAGQHIILRRCTESTEDYYTEHPKIIRMKRLILEFRYYGG